MVAHFDQHSENLWPDFMKALSAFGIVGMRSLQYDVLNAIVETRDILVVSPSGSGKTTAALLSIAWRVCLNEDYPNHCMVLVVESEQQVKRIGSLLECLPEYDPLKVLSLYPASDVSLFHNRTERLRQKPMVIVATPDRLLVHLRVGNISSADIRYIIVDDIDIIYDKGMYRDLEKILGLLENHTCRVVFSSTKRPMVMKSIETFLRQRNDH